MKSPTIVLFCFTILLIDRCRTLTSQIGACLSSLHVDDEPLILNLSEYADCTVNITTAKDRVIAFHYAQGLISDLIDHVKIRDGLEQGMDYVSLEKSGSEELRKLNVNYDKTVHSTKAVAILEIDSPPLGMHLKVSKAVSCPSNLGAESQCGRVVDDVSCYCATFTGKSWSFQKNFCAQNGMKFLAIESQGEENHIYAAWGRETRFWTSLNDLTDEGIYIWDSTGEHAGYTNWDRREPSDHNGDEDCVALNFQAGDGWNDVTCDNWWGAICELHP